MNEILFKFQNYPEKDELLRNMMGLLGNVAEVQRLRPRLMTTEYITVFANLLDSCSDGIEVNFIIFKLAIVSVIFIYFLFR